MNIPYYIKKPGGIGNIIETRASSFSLLVKTASHRVLKMEKIVKTNMHQNQHVFQLFLHSVGGDPVQLENFFKKEQEVDFYTFLCRF